MQMFSESKYKRYNKYIVASHVVFNYLPMKRIRKFFTILLLKLLKILIILIDFNF